MLDISCHKSLENPEHYVAIVAQLFIFLPNVYKEVAGHVCKKVWVLTHDLRWTLRWANLFQAFLDYCFGKIDFCAESFEEKCKYCKVAAGFRADFRNPITWTQIWRSILCITWFSTDVVYNLKSGIAPLIKTVNLFTQLYQTLLLFIFHIRRRPLQFFTSRSLAFVVFYGDIFLFFAFWFDALLLLYVLVG